MLRGVIDIIVPVYKAENTILSCVSSVQSQSYPDWRLVLVNDGSPDSSSEICHSLAMQDSRIIVIDKMNGGPSSARNAGLHVADGEWVMFVDSDDYISPDALADIVNKANNGADLIIPDTVIEFKNGSSKTISHNEGTVSRDDFDQLFSVYHLGSRTSIGGKCFRNCLLQTSGLCFDESLRHSEDMVFVFSFIKVCQKVGFTGKPDYHYIFDNEESLTNQKYPFDVEFHGYKAICSTINGVLEEFKFSDAKAIDDIWHPMTTCVTRTLNSIYHSELHSSPSERRKMIRSLDLDLYDKHKPQSWNRKVIFLNRILLKLKWVWLYDLIRSIKGRHR